MQRPVVVVGGVAQLVYGGRVRRAVSGRRGRRGGGRGIGCRWRCLRVGGRWLWGGGGALRVVMVMVIGGEVAGKVGEDTVDLVGALRRVVTWVVVVGRGVYWRCWKLVVVVYE